uniref:Lipid IV(A) 3-deoxy-D-manno-octulosonic acid transferase n=1 Tax=Oryza meridionalis TaxID=40149 RepID=A0A0E0CAI6_9ORYZ
MGAPSREDEETKKMEAGGDTVGQKLDAGALFVLQSKGSWLHCGYHLTTSIVAPPLLSLPFAFASLGWAAGLICLVIGAAVTFYSYNLISLVLEHHAQQGRRQLRFRDMATDILGPGWGRFYIGPIQFLVCFGAVVACTLLAGQSMKAIYLIANPGGTIKLYVFVAIFGVFMMILAQMPSFHSLRHVNLISLVLCLAYSFCAVAACIYLGSSKGAPEKDYSIAGANTRDRVFGVFNAIAVIATTYGNGIIPEIQATVAAPVTGKMFKGLCLCYAVVVTTFFSVAISGYWAFGNQSQGTLLSNFMVGGRAVIPEWLLLIIELFTLLQLSAVAVVYLQPTNEVLEGLLSDPKAGQYAARNVAPRVLSRTAAVALGTTIAAMVPFFGDMNALIGAFGFLPLDFAVPAVFYNVTFKPSKKGAVFWLNTTIAVVFSALAVVASVAAVRQIILDANSYKLFANSLDGPGSMRTARTPASAARGGRALYELYRAASRAAAPAALLWRRLRGLEHPSRWPERLGRPSVARPRPGSPLVWFHAVSLGEGMAALPVVRHCARLHPGLPILLTTTTLSSFEVMKDLIPDGVIYQFAPLDCPDAIENFIGYWKPSLILLMESELWPNLIVSAAEKRIAVVLLNARMSLKSFNRWSSPIGLQLVSLMLSKLSLIIPLSTFQAVRFQLLHAPPQIIHFAGDLKYAVGDIDAGEKAVAAIEDLQQQFSSRPVWMAASIHKGEDKIILRVHDELIRMYPNLLLILVPRYPRDIKNVSQTLKKQKVNFVLRSTREVVSSNTSELRMLYRVTPIAVIGGSFLPGLAGHNISEAAAVGCAVKGEYELLEALKQLLGDSRALEACQRAAKDAFSNMSDGVVNRVWNLVRTFTIGSQTDTWGSFSSS